MLFMVPAAENPEEDACGDVLRGGVGGGGEGQFKGMQAYPISLQEDTLADEPCCWRMGQLCYWQPVSYGALPAISWLTTGCLLAPVSA